MFLDLHIFATLPLTFSILLLCLQKIVICNAGHRDQLMIWNVALERPANAVWVVIVTQGCSFDGASSPPMQEVLNSACRWQTGLPWIIIFSRNILSPRHGGQSCWLRSESHSDSRNTNHTFRVLLLLMPRASLLTATPVSQPSTPEKSEYAIACVLVVGG